MPRRISSPRRRDLVQLHDGRTVTLARPSITPERSLSIRVDDHRCRGSRSTRPGADGSDRRRRPVRRSRSPACRRGKHHAHRRHAGPEQSVPGGRAAHRPTVRRAGGSGGRDDGCYYSVSDGTTAVTRHDHQRHAGQRRRIAQTASSRCRRGHGVVNSAVTADRTIGCDVHLRAQRCRLAGLTFNVNGSYSFGPPTRLPVASASSSRPSSPCPTL